MGAKYDDNTFQRGALPLRCSSSQTSVIVIQPNNNISDCKIRRDEIQGVAECINRDVWSRTGITVSSIYTASEGISGCTWALWRTLQCCMQAGSVLNVCWGKTRGIPVPSKHLAFLWRNPELWGAAEARFTWLNLQIGQPGAQNCKAYPSN